MMLGRYEDILEKSITAYTNKKKINFDGKRLKCKVKFSPLVPPHCLISLPPGDDWLWRAPGFALYEHFPVFGNNY